MQAAADAVESFDASADLAASFGIAQPTRLRDAAEARLEDRPTLWPCSERWWAGWWVLHAGRQYAGMAGTPVGLSYQEMTAYARDHRMPRDISVALWQAMDAEFRAVLAEQAKEDDATPTPADDAPDARPPRAPRPRSRA